MSKIKILISTDSAGIHTGLAETTRLVFNRLLDKYPDKYDLHQLGWFNFNATEKVRWPIHTTHLKQEGNKRSPDHSDRYGQRTFENLRNKINPDIVYTNGDLWCFDHVLNSPKRNTFRLVVYYTIDGQPYWGSHINPGKDSEWGGKLTMADRVVVLTEWGKDVLAKSCPELSEDMIDVIYHPADMDRFKLYTEEERMKLRHQMYNPQIPRDAFMLGWVGRNQFRKMNFKMWEVMHYIVHGDYIRCTDCGRVTCREWDHSAQRPRDIGKLMKFDPDYDYRECWYCKSKSIELGRPIENAYLWMHMNRNDPGWNPDMHAKMWDVQERITFTAGLQASKGLSPKTLAQLISTWDGMLYLSGGEGFGIPAFESLMAGVPIIYSNYSSHADFCKHGGLPVRVDYIPELNFAIQRSIADTSHAVERILWAYENPEEFRQIGLAGRAFAETKNVDATAEQWDKVFTEMMKRPLPMNNTSKVYSSVV